MSASLPFSLEMTLSYFIYLFFILFIYFFFFSLGDPQFLHRLVLCGPSVHLSRLWSKFFRQTSCGLPWGRVLLLRPLLADLGNMLFSIPVRWWSLGEIQVNPVHYSALESCSYLLLSSSFAALKAFCVCNYCHVNSVQTEPKSEDIKVAERR